MQSVTSCKRWVGLNTSHSGLIPRSFDHARQLLAAVGEVFINISRPSKVAIIVVWIQLAHLRASFHPLNPLFPHQLGVAVRSLLNHVAVDPPAR